MKKIICGICLSLTLFILYMPVFAQNGDIAGNVYSTDILAYVNGVEIESYNIGGKTAIVIEDVLNEEQYIYDDSSRTLKIFSLSPYYLAEEKCQKKRPTRL